MTEAQESEPPAWFRPPLFMVGQDRRGNWVVRTKRGRAAAFLLIAMRALRFVRSENGFKPQAVVMISGGFELDISRNATAPARPEKPLNLVKRRRIA